MLYDMSSSQTSPKAAATKIDAQTSQNVDDDEPDDWDKRIYSTGCYSENMKLTDCYYETKDWRACKDEMKIFKECWKRHGNAQRTSTKEQTS